MGDGRGEMGGEDGKGHLVRGLATRLCCGSDCVVLCIVVAPITEMAAKKCLRVSDQPRMLRRDNSCQLNPRVASQNIQRVPRNLESGQRSDQKENYQGRILRPPGVAIPP